MSTTKKILIAIFCIVLIGILAGLITWCVINFNKVKDVMAGTNIYTKDDLDKAYEDGYNTAFGNKDEYEDLVNSYKDTIIVHVDTISKLNNEKTLLSNANAEMKSQITTLTDKRDLLQSEVDTLLIVKANNEKAISDLNDEIVSLQQEIADAQENENASQQSITQLTLQLDNLQAMYNQLQVTNQMNVQTITSLNAQIIKLNNDIVELNNQLQSNSNLVLQLNSRITELQNTVIAYEQLISNFVPEGKVIVTFEYDGSLYNVQAINKGEKVSIAAPSSTEYKIFNGWTLNGDPIDLATYIITENVKIVADVTYKYIVNFSVDGVESTNQIVLKGNNAVLPSAPQKSGYLFKYWTLDGNAEVNVEETPINSNTTFIARFVKLCEVSFVFEDTTLETRQVEEYTITTPYTVDSTDYKVFNGWKVNGEFVNVNTYLITDDTVFTADIIYKYDVTFKIDDSIYDTQIVTMNNKVDVPTPPTKSNYEFDYWTLDGETRFNFTNFVVTDNITFIAKFTRLFTVNFYDREWAFGLTPVLIKTVRAGEVVSTDYVPTRELYEFDGWSIRNGLSSEVIDISTYTIEKETDIYPLFTKVASYVYVYDGNTCIYNSIHRIGEKVNIRVTPLGREGYRFVGYFNGDLNYEDKATVSTVNYYPTITVGSSSVTYRAYYSAYCMGNFVSDKYYLNLGYIQGTPLYNDGASYIANVATDVSGIGFDYDAIINLNNYDFKNGTYKHVYSENRETTGTYNKNTDTWTFVCRYTVNGVWKEKTTVFTRSAYAKGVFNTDILK